MYPDSWWNYRVVREVSKPLAKNVEPEEYFNIYSCFYRKGSKLPDSWTEAPEFAQGETIEALKADLHLMLEACERPVLEFITKEGEAVLREVQEKKSCSDPSQSPS